MTTIHAARRTFRWDWGRDYVCGGINGGERDAYLKFCHTLQKRIRQDKDRGIIALWHDESHINWYAFTHPHYRLLDASFAFSRDGIR